MARARNIKPGFFKNYELADLGPVAQLLFAGLWCLADREGRLEDRPRLIKAELFPYYECDVNGELTELERLGFVNRYSVGDVAVVEVVHFKKHQTPHNTEKASALPACDDSTARKPAPMLDNGEPTVKPPLCNDGKTPDSLIHRFTDSLIPDSLIPDSAPQTSAAAPAKIRGTRLPKDWRLPKELWAWSMSQGMSTHNIQAEEAKFADYWHAKTGKDATKADWSATWRNWCRNSRPTRQPANPQDEASRRADSSAGALKLLGIRPDDMETIDA